MWLGRNVFKWHLNLFGFKLSAANIFSHSKHTGLSSFAVKPSAKYGSSYFLVLAFRDGCLSHLSLFAFLFICSNFLWCLLKVCSLHVISPALWYEYTKNPYNIAQIFPACALTMSSTTNYYSGCAIVLYFSTAKKHTPWHHLTIWAALDWICGKYGVLRARYIRMWSELNELF